MIYHDWETPEVGEFSVVFLVSLPPIVAFQDESDEGSEMEAEAEDPLPDFRVRNDSNAVESDNTIQLWYT